MSCDRHQTDTVKEHMFTYGKGGEYQDGAAPKDTTAEYMEGYSAGCALRQNESYQKGRNAGHSQGHQKGHALVKAEGIAEGGALELGRGYHEGHINGRDEGYIEGHDQGKAEGTSEGYTNGHAEGLRIGKAEGHQEGKLEGNTEGIIQGYRSADKELLKRMEASYHAGVHETMLISASSAPFWSSNGSPNRKSLYWHDRAVAECIKRLGL
jgi:flagellar biosynthesis/type III secretory pathway protein FliH